jgi:hypothetical protein
MTVVAPLGRGRPSEVVMPASSLTQLGAHRVAPRTDVGVRYLRFTLLQRCAESKRKLGALVGAHDLRDDGDLSADEHEQLRCLLGWFNRYLEVPGVLSEPGNHRALCWFKPQAREPLRRMWALREIYRAQGIIIEVHRTCDPGIVLYEDGWQVVAKPRRGVRAQW